MPARYGKPRRLNIVSFLFLAAAAVALYSLVQFGPVYYRRWKAAGVVAELTNKLYSKRMLSGEGETAFQSELRQELLTRFREIGIDETTAQPTFQKTMSTARLTVSYREVVRHPLVGRTTTLDFTLSEDVKKETE